MSAPPNARGTPIAGKDQLIAYLAAGEKPPSAWRIGAEHEKFVFRLADHRPAPYAGPRGIQALLSGLRRFGWQPLYEEDRLLALAHQGCSITLEPGGQFELSGAPRETLHEIEAELASHLQQVREVASELGLGLIGLGFEPKWAAADAERMPKQRSDIMRRYMPLKGGLGLDMMHRTCTVQVNLDFASEADMVQKFRVALALQPLATALFAASPFTEGQPNGYLSYRSHIWSDTDPDRTGMLPFVFDQGFGYERYVDYMLDVPMYFVFRDGGFIDAAGQSFRDFIAGRLPALPGETPHLGDWSDHLTTSFPEVRLKRFLEMRGADCGPLPRLCALPAFWVGLFYDQAALDAAYDLVQDWPVAAMQALRDSVPVEGLAAKIEGRSLREVALDALSLARAGLRRRARIDAQHADEAHFLDPLFAIAGSGKTPAEDLLDDFRDRWGGNIDRIYEECAYW